MSHRLHTDDVHKGWESSDSAAKEGFGFGGLPFTELTPTRNTRFW